jgi:hypothetical protein
MAASKQHSDTEDLKGVRWQREELETTYWAVLISSQVLTLVAVLLIAGAGWELLYADFHARLLYPLGGGLLLLLLLFLFRPLDQVHKLIADKTSLVVLISAYEYRIAAIRQRLVVEGGDHRAVESEIERVSKETLDRIERLYGPPGGGGKGPEKREKDAG